MEANVLHYSHVMHDGLGRFGPKCERQVQICAGSGLGAREYLGMVTTFPKTVLEDSLSTRK